MPTASASLERSNKIRSRVEFGNWSLRILGNRLVLLKESEMLLIIASFIVAHFRRAHCLLFMLDRAVKVSGRGFRSSQNVDQFTIRPGHELARCRCIGNRLLPVSDRWIGTIQVQKSARVVSSGESVLPGTNHDTVFDLLHAGGTSSRAIISFRPKQRGFDDARILSKYRFAISNRGV